MRRANIVVSTPTLILQPPPNLESRVKAQDSCRSISGLVVEYIVAIDVTRVRFPADAFADPLPCRSMGEVPSCAR